MSNIIKFPNQLDFSEFAKELRTRCESCAGEGKLFTRFDTLFIDGSRESGECYTVCDACKGTGKKHAK